VRDQRHLAVQMVDSMEALGVAVLMGGGPSVVYATHVVAALGQFEEE
jgi:hypothetical protein